MGLRVKIADCIVVMGGKHVGESGFVLEKRKKRVIYYSEQLRKVSWCSIRNARVVHRFEVRVSHPLDPVAPVIDIGCQPYLHGNNLFLW
jgi:ribosomal protein L24